jgi:hypothetical protein
MVIELSQTGRVIHDFRDALAPHREMLTSLEPVSRLFGPEFAYYLRDLQGTESALSAVDNLYDSLVELRETNNSSSRPSKMRL